MRPGQGRARSRPSPQLEELARALGFDLRHDDEGGSRVVPANQGDADQAFRRQVAQALGIELQDLAARLDAGDTVTVTIAMGAAPAPLPPELWEKVTGEPPGGDALRVLAMDQRLSLLLDGRRRLSVES